jgi:hypothetical protein
LKSSSSATKLFTKWNKMQRVKAERVDCRYIGFYSELWAFNTKGYFSSWHETGYFSPLTSSALVLSRVCALPKMSKIGKYRTSVWTHSSWT